MLKRMIRLIDFPLLITPILLGLFGVIMVYSSSMVVSVMKYGGEADLFYLKQLQWFKVGLVAFITFTMISYRFYMKFIKLIFFGSPIVLFIVLMGGRTAGNAQSWLELGGIGFQPSEFVKLALIIYLAAVFSRKQSYIEKFWPAFGPPLIFTMVIFVLIFAQPDLGTGLIVLFISFVVTACSGIRMKHLSGLMAVVFAGILILVPFVSDEQWSRFSAAYDPFAEERADDDGYQLINSYLAIASGGLQGQGLGNSIQKFGYLPEPHTDFIMAIIAEELGLLGVLFVISGIAIIVIRGFQIGIRSEDPFASLLAIGIASMIAIQSIVNLGGLTGMLPLTGVPLPFVSYGGSSLVLIMISAGILNNISIKHKAKEVQHKSKIQKTHQHSF